MSYVFNPYHIDLANTELTKQYASIIIKSKVEYTKELPIPPVCLSVNGQSYATLGNFSLVIGKLKSRKTYFSSMVLAAAVSNSTYSDLITATLPKGKNRVIFIDTEQSKYKVHQVAKRTAEMSSIKAPNNFEVFSFRSMSSDQRMIALQLILHHRKDIGLVIIDGVRDFVSSINDEYQATGVSNMLMRLTEDYNVHIQVVLHENKKDNSARGHLGGELANKAESVLRVQYINKTSSKVTAEYSRDQPIPSFEFSINDDGIPVKSSEFSYGTDVANNKNRKSEPTDVDNEKHIKVIEELQKQFQNEKPKLTELRKHLKRFLKENVETLGDNKVTEYLNYYINKGWIEKIGIDRSPKTYYVIHEPK